MKKIGLIVLIMSVSLSTIFAQKIAVLDFKAGVGINQTDVDGLSSTFVTYFSPRGYQLVERSQINQVIEEQGFQQTSLTESQMVRLGQIMNLSKIVVGDVNIVGGSPNLDVRVIDVQSGEVTGRDGATFAWTNYRATMQQLAQKVAGQIGVVYGGNGQGGYSQPSGKSPSGKVETILGYLQVYPEDLGSFNGEPTSVIAAVNRQRLYDFGDWRLPTNEELSLMATVKDKLGMGSVSGYMNKENANSGGMKIVRLVRSDNANGGSSDGILTQEDLQKAGFRFLKDNTSRNVSARTENGEVVVISNAFYISSDDVVTECHGGTISPQGVLNGLVIIKGTFSQEGRDCSYLAYICEGKMTYPILQVYSYNGIGICLEEGIVSYGCYFSHWDGYRSEGLCGEMRSIYGKDFTNRSVLYEIYDATMDLEGMEKTFVQFVKSGRKIFGPWSSDGHGYRNYYE